jgi:Uma2 family endonuclease
MANETQTVRRTVQFKFTLPAANSSQLASLLRSAAPFYEAFGGRRMRLLQNVDDPARFVHEIEYETHEVYLHDVVGWRRDRVPQRPTGRPVRIRPDWVCELLSPSNAKRDQIDKFQVLHRNGVPHYWIADPLEHTLIVHRWEPRGYLVVLTAAAGDVVRAEPFDAVELRVSTLFGLEDDEE